MADCLTSEVSAAWQAECGAGYPFPWSSTLVDDTLNPPGLSDAGKRAILG